VLRIGLDNLWNEIARKEAPLQGNFFRQILYSGGNDLYWITNDKVIVMDVDKEIIVREYLFPSTAILQVARFLWMGNRFCCIAHKDLYTTFQIYILDFDTGEWSHYHEMGPFDYVAACGHELNILYVVCCLWINDQIIFKESLFGRDIKNIHFSYNVKTKHLTKIEGISMGNFRVWPHVNSLVSFCKYSDIARFPGITYICLSWEKQLNNYLCFYLIIYIAMTKKKKVKFYV